MPNQYFRFKQFTVHQEACAMKVCTDACLQGAYTAAYLRGSDVRRVLDIGTGTGLLSLMLAQELPDTVFNAVELDTAAAGQAAANFEASPWSERLSVMIADARELPVTEAYDFIITNPPFYETALKSSDKLRNQAMHATTLDYRALLRVIAAQLNPSGAFSVLLPYSVFDGFRELAAAEGYLPEKILHVKQSEKHDRFRTIGIFRRNAGMAAVDTIAIRDTGHQQYTAAFTALLKPYYLYLT